MNPVRCFVVLSIVFVTAACNLTAAPTDTAITTVQYYAFATLPNDHLPAESVIILPDQLVLVPTVTAAERLDHPAKNIRLALESMLLDPRNVWTSNNLVLERVEVIERAAYVHFTGEIRGVGDIVLSAARWQILFTIFAEPNLDFATVTLNNDNIGNLGISHSSEAKPFEYAYTPTEVNAFRVMQNNPR